MKKKVFIKRLMRVMRAIHEQYFLPMRAAEDDNQGAEQNDKNDKNNASTSTAPAASARRPFPEVFYEKPVVEWAQEDLKTWVESAKKLFFSKKSSEIYDWESHHFHVLMAVINRGVKLSPNHGFIPRDTQIISTLMFLDTFGENNSTTKNKRKKATDGEEDFDEDDDMSEEEEDSRERGAIASQIKGRLGQVETGEGKSYIVAMTAAALTIPQKFKVDFMTANKILATEQHEEWEPFYKSLGVVSHTNL